MSSAVRYPGTWADPHVSPLPQSLRGGPCSHTVLLPTPVRMRRRCKGSRPVRRRASEPVTTTHRPGEETPARTGRILPSLQETSRWHAKEALVSRALPSAKGRERMVGLVLREGPATVVQVRHEVTGQGACGRLKAEHREGKYFEKPQGRSVARNRRRITSRRLILVAIARGMIEHE